MMADIGTALRKKFEAELNKSDHRLEAINADYEETTAHEAENQINTSLIDGNVTRSLGAGLR